MTSPGLLGDDFHVKSYQLEHIDAHIARMVVPCQGRASATPHTAPLSLTQLLLLGIETLSNVVLEMIYTLQAMSETPRRGRMPSREQGLPPQ